MVKTTIILEDELYRKVVKEAVDVHGSARNISTVINAKLREAFGKKKLDNPWRELWGTLKTDVPTQKLKDLAREGWEH